MTDEITKTIERVLGKGVSAKINSQGGQAFMPAVQIMIQCLILEELRKLNEKPGKKQIVPKED